MSSSTDTIAAIATAAGQGGIGVIRLSGPQAASIATQLSGKLPKPRYAGLRSFDDHSGQSIDSGIVLHFPAPHSFTGEDVVELQGHGGPVVLNQVLQRCISLGARQANPGEFSERAFLNNKLDLAQAEAVADLIASSSAAAAQAAMRSLQGEFSTRVQQLTQALIQLRVHIESAIDFPEEEIDFLADERILQQLADVETQLAKLLQQSQQGRLLRDGITLVLAGEPNVGKSSLLNRLAGYDAAIVADQPGTTRDTIREQITLQGVPLHIIDTAGLRHSDDQIELEGMRRTQQALNSADVILWLVDDRKSITADPASPDQLLEQLHNELDGKFNSLQSVTGELSGLKPKTQLLLHNKCDLTGNTAGLIEKTLNLNSGKTATISNAPLSDELSEAAPPIQLRISAQTGAGIEILIEQLLALAGYQQQEAGQFSARQRHITALKHTATHLQQAREQLVFAQAGECAAEELRLAQQFLSQITGKFSSDDLLGEIFSNFCIGK